MRKNRLKAALFDLDGVVFDTEPQYSVFWGSQCRLYHPERPGMENEIKGQTLDEILQAGWSGELEAERPVLIARLNDFESHMLFNYVPGFTTFVNELRSQGVKTAVVTSSNRIKMENVYKQRPEVLSLFDAILTSEEFTESKPSPDCYLKAATKFGVLPDECSVFEDSFNGLRSGRAAGMFVVGLATTNPIEQIRPLSDYQTNNYIDLHYQNFIELWQAI